MMIRALIADDEPLARERIRTLAAADPELEIVGECAHGREAVEAIRREAPDLLFLDVQMPGLDGFGVLQAVGPERMPATIFVTAYDRYALRAFEVAAVDYLLKPFDRERFQKALRRAKGWLRQKRRDVSQDDVNRRLLAALESLRPEPRYLERLMVKSAGRILFLPAAEIDWIEATGNYVRLHAGRDAHLLRDTMRNLETGLDPARFVRIHRSAIVNIERVQEMHPWFHGDFEVLLRGGRRLTLSRGYRHRLEAALGRRL